MSAKIFANYRHRRGAQTLRQQDIGLRAFARYLATHHDFPAVPLNESPDPWRKVTWSLIMDFAGWLLNQGYATRAPALPAVAVQVLAP